jgi:hypothetical protein
MCQAAHQSTEGLRSGIGDVDFAGDPAGEQHNNTMRDLDDFVEVGADHHHAQPRFAGRENGIAHVVDGADVQSAERIVGHKQARLLLQLAS